jgi:hypothetical protein
MIPQVAVINLHSGRRERRLWVPLLPLWLVLAPFVLLALPLFVIGCLVSGVRPLGALSGIWQVLCALRGARVDVTRGTTATSIDIR